MGNFGLHLREGGRRELLYRDNQINLCAKLTFDSFRISTFLQIRPAEEGLHLQELNGWDSNHFYYVISMQEKEENS